MLSPTSSPSTSLPSTSFSPTYHYSFGDDWQSTERNPPPTIGMPAEYFAILMIAISFFLSIILYYNRKKIFSRYFSENDTMTLLQDSETSSIELNEIDSTADRSN
jgi:hypothetical protein